MSNQIAKHYDLVINGGGIVGFTLLNTLLKSPFTRRSKILLIEQADRYAANQKKLSQDDLSRSSISDLEAPKYSNRVSSLTLSTRRYYKELGVWDYLKNQVKQVNSIKTWNYDYNHRIDFQPSHQYRYKGINCPNEDGTLFSVAENNRIIEALMRNLANITKDMSSKADDLITWNSQVASIDMNGSYIEIKGKNCTTGEEFTTNTLSIVGCDGVNSITRKAAGFRYFERNLNKTAIVGTVEMDNRHFGDKNNVAYQRFSPKHDTVAALLPLDEHYSSFVISCPTNYAEELLSCDDEDFIKRFNQLLIDSEVNPNILIKGLQDFANLTLDTVDLIHKRLVPASNIEQFNPDRDIWYDLDDNSPKLLRVVAGSRAAYPLSFGTTSPYMVGQLPGSQYQQIALIGDASHRVHPLAGQGLNLGIMDALVLSEELEKSAKNGENNFDPTNLHSLERALNNFQRRRQLHIMPLMASIHALPTLFDIAPTKVLKLFNSTDYLKKSTVEYAS